MEQQEPTPGILRRSSTLWRRLSKRGNQLRPPPPTPKPKPQPQVLRKPQSLTPPPRPAHPGPPPPPPKKRISAPIQPSSKYIVTHWAAYGTSAPRAGRRTLPTDMLTTPFPPFPSQIHTLRWTVPLSAEHVYNLVQGFNPTRLEEKWFIYSEGPDVSGKLKVHFHRSWTGMKVVELYVVIDREYGDGKIVGIKWNGTDQTNWMEKDEARYLVETTCAWVLGVKLPADNGKENWI